MPATLPRLRAERYVQPLREGGSLPAVVETPDGLYVVKFRGAGQGPKALVAEIIVAALAARLALPVPDVALVDIPPPFGRSEPDPEIQDVLRRSHGTNVGLRYLDGAFNYASSPAGDLLDGDFATRLVWLDAFVTNPDRTHRNPNLLIWHRTPWLIDHGAALYAHHDWPGVDDARVATPFPHIRDHVLLDRVGDLAAVGATAAAALVPATLEEIVALVPDDLLADESPGALPPAAARMRYVDYLGRRLAASDAFVAAALDARDELARHPPRPFGARR